MCWDYDWGLVAIRLGLDWVEIGLRMSFDWVWILLDWLGLVWNWVEVDTGLIPS